MSYQNEEPGDYKEINEFLNSDVVKKIEKAKLYQMLLTCDFFDTDVSEEDIVEEVTREVRRFVYYKLECLLGARTGNDKDIGESSPAPAMPWSPSQVNALTAVANRMINGSPDPAAKDPSVKKITKPQATAKVQSREPKQKKEQPPVDTGATEAERQRLAGYRLKNNPDRLPMPSQLQIDTINAQQAEMNSRGAFGSSASSLNSALGQVLTQLVKG